MRRIIDYNALQHKSERATEKRRGFAHEISPLIIESTNYIQSLT